EARHSLSNRRGEAATEVALHLAVRRRDGEAAAEPGRQVSEWVLDRDGEREGLAGGDGGRGRGGHDQLRGRRGRHRDGRGTERARGRQSATRRQESVAGGGLVQR